MRLDGTLFSGGRLPFVPQWTGNCFHELISLRSFKEPVHYTYKIVWYAKFTFPYNCPIHWDFIGESVQISNTFTIFWPIRSSRTLVPSALLCLSQVHHATFKWLGVLVVQLQIYFFCISILLPVSCFSRYT
jgi:hypothetical protein